MSRNRTLALATALCVGATTLSLPAAAADDPTRASDDLGAAVVRIELPLERSVEIGSVEDALPPVARNVLAAVRVIKGLGARNRVYREARSVQRDLRAYYDAQLQTARRQLENREQLGLVDSQVRAYVRVYERLVAERALALGITEDEKRTAKYGFESTLKTEITSALVRTPRFRRGLERAREAVDEVRGAFDQARAAIEGGNPITAALDDVKRRLERLDQATEIAAAISPRLGNTLGTIAERVRTEVDRAEQAVDEAGAAANEAFGELDAVSGDITAGLDATRTVRAEAAMEQAAERIFDRMVTPSGEEPERDVIADAIARDQLTAAQRSVGVATGAIDPADFRRMRERVQAAMLGNSLERIGDICGRLVGAARRLRSDAIARGESPPDTSSPCTLFGDPTALQELIDAENDDGNDTGSTEPDSTGTDDGDQPVVEAADSHPADGVYSGGFAVEEFGLDGTVDANEASVVIDGGSIVGVSGLLAVTGDCEAGSSVTLRYIVDSPVSPGSGVALAVEPPFSADVSTSITIEVLGRCPETGDAFEDLGNEIMDDMDGLVVEGTSVMTIRDPVIDIEFQSPDSEAISVTVTRE